MTISPAEVLRVTTPDGETLTNPFHELPGGTRRAAIVLVDHDIGLPCAGSGAWS